MAQQNMDVKETGINVQGEFVVFYERRPESEKRQVETKPRRKPTPEPTPDSPLAAGLQSLGISVNSDQIESALTACFPEWNRRRRRSERSSDSFSPSEAC